MKFRRLPTILLLFALLISIPGTPTNALQSTRWLHGATGYARAIEMQRESNIPRVVYFYNDRCADCRRLDDQYLTAPSVRRALQRFVAVRINPDYGLEEQEITGRYRVTSYPAFFIMDKESSAPRNVQPFRPFGKSLTPEQFAWEIEEAITFSSIRPKVPRDEPIDPSARGTYRAVMNATKQTRSAKIVAVPSGTAPSPAETKGGSLPAMAAILTKYIDAIGGREAHEKLTSRMIKGSVRLSGVDLLGQLSIYSKSPNKSLTVLNIQPMGQVKHGFDGCTVWNVGDTSGSLTLTGADLSGFSTDANFYGEIRLRELYPGIRLLGTVKKNDGEFYLLEGTSRFGGVVTMYFEIQSGLLTARDLTQQTMRGPIRMHVRYSDWREVDGVKLPFRIVQSTPNLELVFTVQDVKHNIPVDDRLFEKPL